MANLKYKNGNDWNSLSVIRGPKGDNADITINGQTKENAVIYAAEKPGIAGQALISHGDGQAPDWATIAPVATTGNYNDLNGLPTIPSTTNDLISGSSAALTSGGAYTAFAQQGIPAGGTAGQVLIKDSSNNYDTSWGTLSVIDNLNTDNGAVPLSAKQGKILNEKMRVTSTGTNIDDINDYGVFYIFNATGTLPVGYSTTDNNIILISYQWDSLWLTQECKDIRSNRKSLRTKKNGTWGPWIEQKDFYSTSEIVIGTWIDGKPIYRKVIAYTVSESATSAAIPTGISNMKFLIHGYGAARMTGNAIFLPLNFYNEGGWDSFHISGTGTTIQLQRGSQYPMNQIYFILEYTKTTD